MADQDLGLRSFDTDKPSACRFFGQGLLLAAVGAQERSAIEIGISSQDGFSAFVAGFAVGLRYRSGARELVMKVDARKRLRSDKMQIHNARDAQSWSQFQKSIMGTTARDFPGTKRVPQHPTNAMVPLNVSEGVQ